MKVNNITKYLLLFILIVSGFTACDAGSSDTGAKAGTEVGSGSGTVTGQSKIEIAGSWHAVYRGRDTGIIIVSDKEVVIKYYGGTVRNFPIKKIVHEKKYFIYQATNGVYRKARWELKKDVDGNDYFDFEFNHDNRAKSIEEAETNQYILAEHYICNGTANTEDLIEVWGEWMPPGGKRYISNRKIIIYKAVNYTIPYEFEVSKEYKVVKFDNVKNMLVYELNSNEYKVVKWYRGVDEWKIFQESISSFATVPEAEQINLENTTLFTEFFSAIKRVDI